MKKTILFLSFMLLTAVGAWAVPAWRGTFSHTQKDGTVLTLRLVGDEYLHYYVDTNSGERWQRAADGDFVRIDDSQVEQQVSQARQRRSASNQRRLGRSQMANTGGPNKVGTFTTMKGKKRGIVILVNFQDKKFDDNHTRETFDAMFNQEGYKEKGHIGSVSDYFKAQSYGQFELQFDVYGPITLSLDMAYYGGNNPNGNDKNVGAMVKEACQQLYNQGVDFSPYDWNSDLLVDQVFLIYAGYGENFSGADPNTIWPHEWDLYSATRGALRVGNVFVNTYACAAELYGIYGTTLGGMGTAVHEFSHCLGYPDTYDIDYSGGLGMESYDVMCSGSYCGPEGRGEVPVGYTAYERWMAGWLTPTELSEPATITDMPDLGTTPAAYIIYNSSHRDEYFLIENRQSKDWFRYFDNARAGHGLFITHIDYDESVWSMNAPNDDPNRQRIAWVPADKDKNIGYYPSNNQADFFPGTQGVTTFVPDQWRSAASAKWFNSENGSNYSTHQLSDITENTTMGTVSFLFDGGHEATPSYEADCQDGVLSFKSDEELSATLLLTILQEYTDKEQSVTSLNLTEAAISSADINLLMEQLAGTNILLYTTTPSTTANVVVKTNDNSFTCAQLLLTDKKDFKPMTPFTANKVDYSRKSTAGFKTACLPFDLSFDNIAQAFGSGAKLYTFTGIETVDGADGRITLGDFTQGTLPAGTPIVVHSLADTWHISMAQIRIGTQTAKSQTGTPTNPTAIPTAEGSFLDLPLDAACYKLNSEGTEFVKASNGSTISPFRFYLKTAAATAPQKIGMAK
ncbi:MAG: M6 family metalloprotease domain-containing protein [Bacteroidales bacterium]|nr:M6 family metalloprotease domain-containing protein [Candidatus Physcousia equi]